MSKMKADQDDQLEAIEDRHEDFKLALDEYRASVGTPLETDALAALMCATANLHDTVDEAAS